MYYKYRDISKRTEEIIIKKKIWLAKPDTLNDPFECNIPKFTAKQLLKHEEEIMGNQLSGFIWQANTDLDNGAMFFNLKGKEIKRLLKRIQKANNIQRKYKIANNLFKEVGATGFSSPKGQVKALDSLLDNIGIFSLSENPLSKLMWSHYSANHEGIAFGFVAITDSDLADDEYFQPINYSDEPLNLDLSKGMMNGLTYYQDESGKLKSKAFVQIKDKQVQKILFTKTKDWAYEKEWRYMRQEFGNYDLPGKLTRIIFGLKCKDENIKRYIQLCNENFEYTLEFLQISRVQNSTELELNSIHI